MTAQQNGASPEHLLKLSDEVSRIASTLARLSAEPNPQSPVIELSAEAVPEVPISSVRAVIRGRRLRSRYFDEDLFADPAWDMMLDLLEAELSGRRVAVSSLCVGASVPPTTALRWIKTMTDKQMFIRRDDPLDGRRVFIELAPHTSLALRRYFVDAASPPVL